MQVFKSRFGQLITIVVSVILLVTLIGIWVREGFWVFALSTPSIAFVIALIANLYWTPRVEVDAGGVRMVNVFRSHYISWNAIQMIDTKYALTLTAGGKRFSAWAAVAPGRYSAIFASRDQGAHLPSTTYLNGTVRPGDLINSDSGAAAAYIRRLWEQRDRSGTAAVNTSWHSLQIVTLGLLGLVTAFTV